MDADGWSDVGTIVFVAARLHGSKSGCRHRYATSYAVILVYTPKYMGFLEGASQSTVAVESDLAAMRGWGVRPGGILLRGGYAASCDGLDLA